MSVSDVGSCFVCSCFNGFVESSVFYAAEKDFLLLHKIKKYENNYGYLKSNEKRSATPLADFVLCQNPKAAGYLAEQRNIVAVSMSKTKNILPADY